MVIGHKKQLAYLNKLVETKKVPHALIFAGPGHIGKRPVAETIFGESSADTHIVERDPELSEITIGQIRGLRRWAALSPFNSSRKLIIIDGGEEMNLEGMNALLKMLEEPSGETIFIIVTSRLSRLPATIVSRSLVVKFGPVGLEEMAASGLKVPPAEWEWIAGRPGLVLRFLRDPDDDAIKTRREAFIGAKKTKKSDSTAKKLKLAEELAAAPDFFATIDGLALALKDRTAAFKRLGELKELFEITTPNKRIQLEEILLMI